MSYVPCLRKGGRLPSSPHHATHDGSSMRACCIFYTVWT